MADPILQMKVKTEAYGDVLFKDILAAYEEVSTHEVRVGIVAPERTYPDSEATLGEVALWNEFGTHDKNGQQKAPARSFIRTPTDKAQGDIFALQQRMLGEIADQKRTPLDALRKIGTFLVNEMRSTIKRRIAPELRPYTLKKRREQRVKGTVPLLATQFLYKGIGFAVRRQSDED